MNDPKLISLLRRTLISLAIVLTFEGFLRKLNISGTNVLIFFIKDIVVLFLGIHVARAKRPPALDFFWGAYLTTCVLFMPVILSTMVHDPLLAAFGTKQYLLYPVVAAAVFIAYESSPIGDLIRFLRWLALLIIPTASVAIFQSYLPPTHWLNLSVGGEDLEGFSAAGHLRVSSTFSFVAQFCAFLNAEMFILILSMNGLKSLRFFWKCLYLTLIPLLLISCYITGSRGAVVGNIGIIMLACALSLAKFDARSALRVITIIGCVILTLVTTQYLFPDFFAAYSARESGSLLSISGENRQRVLSTLFDWTSEIFSTPLFGHGLGIMSNGSNMVSNYAASFRAEIWTETDYATTLFEGGLYLVFVWYGFRYYIIYQTTRCFLLGVGGEWAAPAAFCQGFVILIGVTSTLAIQPPIAIWWWMAVGTSMVIWWKNVEPPKDEENPTLPPPPSEKKIRGRSTYAERLHGR